MTEMSLAINQQEYGKIKVWLFNLDDSPIVPAQARKLPTISVRNVQAMHNCVHELWAGSGLSLSTCRNEAQRPAADRLGICK